MRSSAEAAGRGKRPELGDRGAVTGDGQRLAAGDAVQHLAALVSQLPNRHRGHGTIVSPVRHIAAAIERALCVRCLRCHRCALGSAGGICTTSV